MRTISFLLLLAPAIAIGQAKAANHPIDGTVTCLHYDTAYIKGPVVIKDDQDEDDVLKTVKDDISYKGEVEFKIGFTDIKCDDAVSNENHHSLSANTVSITCLYYPLLKGNRFEYNKATKQGVLYGPITIVDKGAEKVIGNVADIDLSHERYIVSIR